MCQTRQRGDSQDKKAAMATHHEPHLTARSTVCTARFIPFNNTTKRPCEPLMPNNPIKTVWWLEVDVKQAYPLCIHLVCLAESGLRSTAHDVIPGRAIAPLKRTRNGRVSRKIHLRVPWHQLLLQSPGKRDDTHLHFLHHIFGEVVLMAWTETATPSSQVSTPGDHVNSVNSVNVHNADQPT